MLSRMHLDCRPSVAVKHQVRPSLHSSMVSAGHSRGGLPL